MAQLSLSRRANRYRQMHHLRFPSIALMDSTSNDSLVMFCEKVIRRCCSIKISTVTLNPHAYLEKQTFLPGTYIIARRILNRPLRGCWEREKPAIYFKFQVSDRCTMPL
jgi:hypothetical protein